MSLLRRVLGVVAILCLLGTAAAMTTDIRIDNANCGSALITRDPLETRIVTGDLSEDTVAEEQTIQRCKRAVSQRRFVSSIVLIGGIGAIVAGSRLRSRDLEESRLV